MLYDEVTSMDYEVTTEVEWAAQQVQQITPDTAGLFNALYR